MSITPLKLMVMNHDDIEIYIIIIIIIIIIRPIIIIAPASTKPQAKI